MRKSSVTITILSAFSIETPQDPCFWCDCTAKFRGLRGETGTLLLSESQLDYIENARDRLLVPGGTIIPASGNQYITLISMPMMERLYKIDHFDGLDLRPFNRLRDTASMSFSKVFGFHLRSTEFTKVSPKITVQEVSQASHLPVVYL